MAKYRVMIENSVNHTLSFYVAFQGSGRRKYLFQIPYSKTVHTFFRNGVSGGELMKFRHWKNRRLSMLVPRTLKMVEYVYKYDY